MGLAEGQFTTTQNKAEYGKIQAVKRPSRVPKPTSAFIKSEGSIDWKTSAAAEYNGSGQTIKPFEKAGRPLTHIKTEGDRIWSTTGKSQFKGQTLSKIAVRKKAGSNDNIEPLCVIIIVVVLRYSSFSCSLYHDNGQYDLLLRHTLEIK